jgi:hypothetical protein
MRFNPLAPLDSSQVHDRRGRTGTGYLRQKVATKTILDALQPGQPVGNLPKGDDWIQQWLIARGKFPLPQKNIDPGFVRRGPVLPDIDPGFVRRAPQARDIDPGFTRPGPRATTDGTTSLRGGLNAWGRNSPPSHPDVSSKLNAIQAMQRARARVGSSRLL